MVIYESVKTGLRTVPISELERKNDHWFSDGNKRFFKSKWDSYALINEGSAYAYFISSEKHESLYANINEPRKYTIRKFNVSTGDFSSEEGIFSFQAYTTKRRAEQVLREYLETEPIKADKIQYIKREIESLKYEIKRDSEKITALETE